MALVPTDLPERLRDAGLIVHVLEGWETRGDAADHRAVVLHHTASSSNESPSACANYSLVANNHYNLLVDRNGEVWVGAREKSNSSGDISSAPLGEAHAGRAGTVSAVERGLSDDTSSNSTLMAISAQNNGVGEHWTPALVDGIARSAAVVLEALGIPSEGYVTQHRVLTARKIDNCGDSCPYDYRPLIAAELAGGGGGGGGEEEMTEQEWDRLASEVQTVVVNVLRKEGVSGAATKADTFSDAEKSDIQRIVTDVLRKEGVSGGC